MIRAKCLPNATSSGNVIKFRKFVLRKAAKIRKDAKKDIPLRSLRILAALRETNSSQRKLLNLMTLPEGVTLERVQNHPQLKQPKQKLTLTLIYSKI